MDDARLSGLLERGRVVRLTAIEHEVVLALVTIVEDPSTGVTGGPTLVRHRDHLAALEQARPDSWVLRPLADEDEARAFLDRRREEYDRMWDGCGCPVNFDD